MNSFLNSFFFNYARKADKPGKVKATSPVFVGVSPAYYIKIELKWF